MTNEQPSKKASVVWWWLFYVVFVIYGSLLPFEFVPLPLGAAWTKFLATELLDVGVHGRGDWVSNGVLYVPVGFLTFSILLGRGEVWAKVLALVGATAFVFALAVAVEFLQLYFPGRTVSLNDLIAEWIGGLFGTFAAAYWGKQFWRLISAWRHQALPSLASYSLRMYSALYILFSFFPFDFILSVAEFREKYLSTSWGWFIAPDFLGNGLLAVVIKVVAEGVAALPLGVLLARMRPAVSQNQGWVAGLVLGSALEIGQFFVFSGLAQGISVLTRAFGVAFGVHLAHQRSVFNLGHMRRLLHRHVLALFVAYLIALMAIHGWFGHELRDWDSIDRSWTATQFLPFYYHYFTTEQAALVSVVAVAMMYAPMGLLTWATYSVPLFAFVATLFLATIFESSKLFLDGLHADPTNILIGATTAWLVRRALRFLRVAQSRTVTSEAESIQRADAEAVNATQASLMGMSSIKGKDVVLLATVIVPVLCIAATFPDFNVLLFGALIILSVIFWTEPILILIVVPAALTNLDLAPWTGRFYLDEFDLLMAIALTIGFLKTPKPTSKKSHDFWMTGAVLALVVSYMISAVVGLLPWRPLDTNAFSSYYSPLNGLRVAKGMFWALLFFRLMVRFGAAGKPVFGIFSLGMLLSLLGVVLVGLWERAAFPGLLNFADEYRVTGPFSAMHVGGADLELFLTIAVSFVVLALCQATTWFTRILVLVLLTATTYVLAVSFARIGLAAYAVAVSTSLLLILFGGKSHKLAGGWVAKFGGAAVVFGLLGVITVSIGTGAFWQSRLSKSGQDFETRQQHWRNALEMRDGGILQTIFGMGIGSYPEIHFWRSHQVRAGSLAIQQEGDKTFLRLGKGHTSYLDQVVDVKPGAEYMVQVLLRGPVKNSELMVAICEKWLLTAQSCVETKAVLTGSNQWAAYNLTLNSDDIGLAFGRPIKISLFSGGNASKIDIGFIALRDEQGRNLIKNGSFRDGFDNWFFSTDVDLPWHIWSLPVHLIFEQGWFGLLAFALFLGGALVRTGAGALSGQTTAAVLFASIVGVTVIATMDTGIDTPRMLMLVVLLLLLSWTEERPKQAGRSGD